MAEDASHDQSPQQPYKYPNSVKSLDVMNKSNQLERLREQGPDVSQPSAEGQTVSQPSSPNTPPVPPHKRPEPPIRPHQNRISASPPELKTERQLQIEREVIRATKTVFDPEIPVNLYDLGLIYDIDIDHEDKVHIRMTLTAPGCPVAGSLIAEVERKVDAIPEVKDVTVELVWDPPWDREMMSEVAKVQLDFLW